MPPCAHALYKIVMQLSHAWLSTFRDGVDDRQSRLQLTLLFDEVTKASRKCIAASAASGLGLPELL
jgi:hypothetical protein